ncbi:F-box/kelch-repeat protein [Vitis vinifera]|uniref:F-box/kelch-repeat protein n=1 Tax=Vitis vinifera TaxID=29760 RepID=A0A438H8Z2_VITVI|nr:F-box/kelch-repeat protein [Vitis vinifera]
MGLGPQSLSWWVASDSLVGWWTLKIDWMLRSTPQFGCLGALSAAAGGFQIWEFIAVAVQTLRPPGVSFSFLIACRDQLVLAGLCNSPRGPSVNLWRVDEETMEFSEIAIMPQDLLYKLFDGYGDDKFASLKCVGLGNLIYVFNEEYHKSYPACVCEINSGTGQVQLEENPPFAQTCQSVSQSH